MSDSDAGTAAIVARGMLPPGLDLPGDAGGPVFAEPWQAQAFAMTLRLHERGVFGWDEWADYLSQAIGDARADGDPDRGDTYYRHWVAALERLLRDKGLVEPLVLASLRQAWRNAAEKTPHGEPVRLNAAALRLAGLLRDDDLTRRGSRVRIPGPGMARGR